MSDRTKTAAELDLSRIRLSPGNHGSPGEGACVVELASLMAGEDFSDRPRCVCPVVAAFLRAWNDRLGHADRQRLREYSPRIIGSRGDGAEAAWRREVCLDWAREELIRTGATRLLSPRGLRVRIAIFSGTRGALDLDEGAGDYAARLAFARGDAEAAFELLEALLDAERLLVDREPPAARPTAPTVTLEVPPARSRNRPPSTAATGGAPSLWPRRPSHLPEQRPRRRPRRGVEVEAREPAAGGRAQSPASRRLA